MAAQVRAFPGFPAGGRDRRRYRPPADRAALVPLAVRAHQGQPLRSRGAVGESGRKVEAEQFGRIVPGTPLDTLGPRRRVGKRPCHGPGPGAGRPPRVAPGAADQQHVRIGVRGRAGQPTGNPRLQVPDVQGGRSPWTGHFKQEKPGVADGAGVERFAAHPGRVRAPHRGQLRQRPQAATAARPQPPSGRQCQVSGRLVPSLSLPRADWDGPLSFRITHRKLPI